MIGRPVKEHAWSGKLRNLRNCKKVYMVKRKSVGLSKDGYGLGCTSKGDMQPRGRE